MRQFIEDKSYEYKRMIKKYYQLWFGPYDATERDIQGASSPNYNSEILDSIISKAWDEVELMYEISKPYYLLSDEDSVILVIPWAILDSYLGEQFCDAFNRIMAPLEKYHTARLKLERVDYDKEWEYHLEDYDLRHQYWHYRFYFRLCPW